jgi:hypothetical protein
MSFKLFINGIYGKTYLISNNNLSPETTIKDLKNYISLLTGIPEQQQRL